jgi:hypothetical protein
MASGGHEGASPCVANSRASLLYVAMNAQNSLHSHQVALPIENLLGEGPQRKRLKIENL